MEPYRPLEDMSILLGGVMDKMTTTVREGPFSYAFLPDGTRECTLVDWEEQAKRYLSLFSQAIVSSIHQGKNWMDLRVRPLSTRGKMTIEFPDLRAPSFDDYSIPLIQGVVAPALRRYLRELGIDATPGVARHQFAWGDEVKRLIAPPSPAQVRIRANTQTVFVKLWAQLEEQPERCLLVLRAGTDTFRVHACVMATVCRYLNDLIPPRPEESLELEGITTVDSLRQLIRFAYGKELHLNVENAPILLDFALNHEIDGLQIPVASYIAAHIEDFSSDLILRWSDHPKLEPRKKVFFTETLAYRAATASPESVRETVFARK